MGMDVNQTYCGDHFTIYTNIKSLCCIPETNIMLYVNYTSILKSYKFNRKIKIKSLKNQIILKEGNRKGMTRTKHRRGRWWEQFGKKEVKLYSQMT